MIQLAGLLFVFALAGLAFMFGVMVIIGGLRFDDVRDLLLHDAYRSFTFEGDRIPGLSPNLAALVVIRLLSSEDDARLALVPELHRVRRLARRFDRLRAMDVEIASFAVFRAR